jgi:hypothetical protein
MHHTNPQLNPAYLGSPWAEWRAVVQHAVERGWIVRSDFVPLERAMREEASRRNHEAYQKRLLLRAHLQDQNRFKTTTEPDPPRKQRNGMDSDLPLD